MQSNPLSGALLIDLLTLSLCAALGLRIARSILHPAWMFLGLHLYIVTARLLTLINGSSPLNLGFAWPISISEIPRASLASDLGLLGFAAGWVLAPILASKHPKWLYRKLTPVNERRILSIAMACFLLGIPCALSAGRLDQSLRQTSWQTSGYVATMASWASCSICLLHYLYGFPKALIAFSGCVIAFVGITNVLRSASIIPMIFLVMLWFSRRTKQSFPLLFFPLMAMIVLLWLPMKPLTKALYDGLSVGESVTFAVESTEASIGGSVGTVDEQFLDMVASTITLADLRGTWYWGGTIQPLLVSPIPRALWPEKPFINQYQRDLDVPSRPFAKIGMTAGLVGEGYVNCRLFGVFIICFVTSLGYTLLYRRAAPPGVLAPGLKRSPQLLLYLALLSCSMVVYRDGLLALLWFPFFYSAPISFGAWSHWAWRPRSSTRSEPRRQSVQDQRHTLSQPAF